MEQHRIDSRQLMFIINGAQVGTTMLALPSLLAGQAAQHAWLAVLLGALGPAFSLFLIVKLGRSWPEHNFVEINRRILGKIGGAAAVLLFVAWAVVFVGFAIHTFLRTVNIYLLPNTPLWATGFLVMLVLVYAGSKGGQVVGRINETLFFGLMLSILIILVPTSYSSETTNLLPLWEIEPGLLKALFYSLYTYIGTEVLLVYYALVTEPDKVLGAAMKGLGLTVFFYLVVTICCLLVFGPYNLVRQTFAVLTILKVAQVPVVERLEFYFLAFWVGVILRRGINLFFAGALSLSQLLGKEASYRWALIGMGAAIQILILFPSSVPFVIELRPYMVACWLGIGIVYPLLLLGIGRVRKGGLKTNEGA